MKPQINIVGELPEKLRSFLREGEVSSEAPLIALQGGGNNQVYRVPGPKGDYVLKRYFQDPTDPRDRFNTERAFYDFLWERGVRQIPKPHLWDGDNRLGLFTFVVGRKLKPEEITNEVVDQALQFIIQTNASKENAAAQKISAAADAYFSIAEELDTIARRVEAARQIEPHSEVDEQAVAFVRDELHPAWLETAAAISRSCRSGLDFDQPLKLTQRCLSPSDFGFHNALMEENGRLHFIDFEYAGWDDPAKLICDFFCQPQVPVPFQFWELFTNSLAASLGGDGSLPIRAKLLLPAHQLKWCCIILNHFVKGGKARRDFARGAGTDEAKAGQLSKARRLLQSIHKLQD